MAAEHLNPRDMIFRFTRPHLAIFLLVGISGLSFSNPLSEPGLSLVGSTPGDSQVKKILGIPEDMVVDFIRWDLSLLPDNTFQLVLGYGEIQPNTLSFKNDGGRKVIRGHYRQEKRQNPFREVLWLEGKGVSAPIAFVKINENIFHILTPENRLMIGNGGWSYSLSRQKPIDPGDILITSSGSDDTSPTRIFDGRTPCREFAAEYPELNASEACFKLKWRLTLHRDPVTFQPTTCGLREIVDNEPRDLVGTWSILPGTAENPGSVIYKIEPEGEAHALYFLVGDENVLFFLNDKKELLTGNADFGFALNRRK